MQNDIKKILDNTVCFTHGGTLGGLYGILATNKISSHNALQNHGDNTAKFTDPDKSFSQEDNFLFFESMADRGNLTYSSLIDKKQNHVGFSFLLVASADTLLKQVNMIGNSDGILLGRKDEKALELDLSKIDTKILVPESYKEDVTKFCVHLKELGHTPPEHLLVFKPITELNNILQVSAYTPEEVLSKQYHLCKEIGLKAQQSTQEFSSSEKVISTKTSSIGVAMSQNTLEDKLSPQKLFTNGRDLLEHMKERPTPANLQRNSMLLFLEKSNSLLSQSVTTFAQGRPPLLDIASNPKDLAFALNTLAEMHPFKEDSTSGEKRISSYEIRNITARFKKYPDITGMVSGICECLEEVKNKRISVEDCAKIMQKHMSPQEDTKWFIAINRIQQPPVAQSKIKLIVDLNTNNEIMVWKEGMKDWANIKDVPELNLSKASLNITEMRKKAFSSSNDMALKS
jgi:GYF domain 2